MTEIMTASENGDAMTGGQIETLIDSFRAALRKHRHEIPKDVAQKTLGLDNLGMRMFAAFRDITQAVSGLTIRIVKVDRTRTPQQALDATGRDQYTDRNVAAAMPKGEGDEVELIYFKPDESVYKIGWISCTALAAEYEKRGLVPDPRAQIDDNAANPDFADETPNACQYQDANGNFYCVSFYRWYVERHVRMLRSDGGWYVGWVFAGVRKESSES